jgi:hypothetical protein
VFTILSCITVSDQTSLPYSKTGNTHARKIQHWASIDIDFLYQMMLQSILKAADAFASLVSISFSID